MTNKTKRHAAQLAQDIARLEAAEQATQPLTAIGAWGDAVHCFESKQAHALIAALAANRPLLVRGEPGVGKSQLARAAAAALGRRFVPAVVQPNSEYADLLWSVDYTRRLADAQLAAHTGKADRLEEMKNYVGPGPLWWAFAWQDAEDQYALCPHNYCPPADANAPDPIESGIVLLIDEIDKADISLANGLLEVLGNSAFAVPLLDITVVPVGRPPLVVITSNDIRELPPALVRRCVVLELSLPASLQAYLVEIGAAHFPDFDADVLAEAARQILEDRAACRELPKTGLAEYLDLLRALDGAAADQAGQLEWLDRLGCYFHKSQAVPR
ncbi:MAG: AAA family ATPase [Candidatus Thiodiazotropha sp. (ex Epidulcina cf. delphinae)]|nr:AAA family ATPase [Candidatus Thiodiazotropha sp. (ex Epidulcina cf. delphinae)]